MHKISWRVKLFIFFGLAALLPLAISGWNIIGIADDEFVSSTNTELSSVAGEISSHINYSFTNQWLQPLFLIRSSLEKPELGINEKVALINSSVQNINEILAIQIFMDVGNGIYSSAVQITKSAIEKKYADDPSAKNLNMSETKISSLDKKIISKSIPEYYPKIDKWALTISIPISIGGKAGLMVCSVDATSLKEYLETHSFSKTGNVYIINANGIKIFEKGEKTLNDKKVVQEAMDVIKSGARAMGTKKYTSTDGEKMVSCYAFPENMDWAVIAEIKESKAYEPVFKIRNSLLVWILFGIGIALAGGFLFSNDISKPIIKLSKEAEKVTAGNFDINVTYKGKDAIGVLGSTLENMSHSLKESFARIAEQNRLLEEYNRSLEQKVADRTIQLKEKNETLELTLQKLKDTQEQLVMQQKLASLGQLTAGIAHEIKNPLNFVNNFAKLSVGLVAEIEDELNANKDNPANYDVGYLEEILGDIKTNVKKISEHGARADNIVKNMLEHSRSDSGEFAQTDLNKLLEEAVSLSYHGMKTQDQEFNTELILNLDKNIPVTKLNAQALSQVFINLCNNSFYALKKKKISGIANYEPQFIVTTINHEKMMEIQLRDNGTGIPKDILKKIFEPFFTTKPTGEGTGLGLSLSFDIVSQIHRGEMSVDSEENSFSQFVIKLPKDL